jgi:hypothetical protein
MFTRDALSYKTINVLCFLVTAAFFVLGALPSPAFEPEKGGKLQVGPASSYPCKQTVQEVTIAAEVYNDPDKMKAAFGKLDPRAYGVLPVLLIVANHSKQSIRLDEMKVEYIQPDRSRVEATPASEVKYLDAPRRPNLNPRLPGISRSHKNPLTAWEIEGRAFSAKMLPPGESAHGFVYFQTVYRPGSRLYITGLREASGGKELFFFEIPLEQ